MINRVVPRDSSRDFPKRVHIVGGPGTGKSTLARSLGQMLCLPVFDLDKIAFAGKDFVPRPLAAKMAEVRKITAEHGWISEGIFLGWTDELLKAADLVIWLDHVTWPVAAYRIVRRFLAGGVEEAKRQPGIRKVNRFDDYTRHASQLVLVLLSTRTYYKSASKDDADEHGESRDATLRSLAPYSNKVVHCQSQAEVDALITEFARLERDPLTPPLRS